MLSKLQYLAVLSACISQSVCWTIANSPGPQGIECVTSQENTTWTEAEIISALGSLDILAIYFGKDDNGGRTYGGSGTMNINPLPPPAAVILDPLCTNPPNGQPSQTIYTNIGADAVLFQLTARTELTYCAVVTNSDTQGQGWHQCNAASNPAPAGKERRSRIQRV